MGVASITVFQAFPNALEQWYIGEAKYSTIIGNTIIDEWQSIDVIADEGDAQDQNRGDTAAVAESDTLLYAKPNQLPTLDTSELIASYLIKDCWGNIYAIKDAGLGKNPETRQIEHVELRLRKTEAEDGYE